LVRIDEDGYIYYVDRVAVKALVMLREGQNATADCIEGGVLEGV
jgi:long-subunit acyl-CoA synthetase (AMP-forming)